MVLIFTLGILPLSAFASNSAATSALLLADPLSARPLAMGNAFSAVADDESAINTNPAGLVQARNFRLAGAHLQGLVGTQIESLAAVYPRGPRSALGLQLAFLRDDDQRRDDFGNLTGVFSNSNFMAGLAWSTRLGKHWALGLGAKGIQERYDDLEQLWAAADLGLQGRWHAWQLGLHVQNLGLSLNQRSGSASNNSLHLPLRVAAGIARNTFLPNWISSVQVTSLPLQNRLRLSAGTELSIGFPETKGMRLALRAGYQYDLLQEDVGRVSVGVGIVAPPYFELNYALINFGLLGNNHRVSLVFILPSLKAKIAPGEKLLPVYDLKVLIRDGGIILTWNDNNTAVKGYHVYTDYGYYDEQLTSRPVQGRSQKFIRVVKGQTYNFYVRAVGSDEKPGPISEVLTWTAP